MGLRAKGCSEEKNDHENKNLTVQCHKSFKANTNLGNSKRNDHIV